MTPARQSLISPPPGEKHTPQRTVTALRVYLTPGISRPAAVRISIDGRACTIEELAALGERLTEAFDFHKPGRRVAIDDGTDEYPFP